MTSKNSCNSSKTIGHKIRGLDLRSCCNLILDEGITEVPFLNQVIIGFGCPIAIHCNSKLEPAPTEKLLENDIIFGFAKNYPN